MMAYWDEERNCLLNGGGEEGRCAKGNTLRTMSWCLYVKQNVDNEQQHTG
jgi:hypothetical protein